MSVTYQPNDVLITQRNSTSSSFVENVLSAAPNSLILFDATSQLVAVNTQSFVAVQSISSSYSISSSWAPFTDNPNAVSASWASSSISSSYLNGNIDGPTIYITPIIPSTSSFVTGSIIQTVSLQSLQTQQSSIGAYSFQNTHGTINVNNKLYGATVNGVIYCFTNPDVRLTSFVCSLVTGSTGIYQLCYVSSSNLIYGIGTHKLISFNPNNLVNQSVLLSSNSLGIQSSICTDGTYLYVVSETSPSSLFKINLSGSIISQSTWTGVNSGHNCFMDSNNPTFFYVSSATGYVAKVSSSNLQYTQSFFGGVFTDDAAILNGYLYLGRENVRNIVVINTSSFSSSTVPADTSYGIFTDGINLYNTSNSGSVVYYPNANLTTPYRYYFPNKVPNELWITSGGKYIITDWYNSDVLWIRINTSSFISVGKSAASYSLDVAGTLHADQFYGDVSNASGLWWNYNIADNSLYSKNGGNITLAAGSWINPQPSLILNGYNLSISSGGNLNMGGNPIQNVGTLTASATVLNGDLTLPNNGAYFWDKLSVGANVNTSSFRGTIDINDGATGYNVLSGSLTQITNSGNFNDSNGNLYIFNIYAYKTISGTTYYSKNPLQLSYQENSSISDNQYYLQISWSAVANVDGYKLVLYDNGNDYYHYDYYLTSSVPSINYGDGTENLATNQVPMILTPLFSGSNIYTSPLNGDLICANTISASAFYGTSSWANISISSSYLSGNNVLYHTFRDGYGATTAMGYTNTFNTTNLLNYTAMPNTAIIYLPLPLKYSQIIIPHHLQQHFGLVQVIQLH
jgi:hypothetical protein